MADITRFIQDVRTEARRVSWPSFKETRGMAIMVLLLVIIVATFLVSIDLVIGFSLSHLLGLSF